MSLHIGARPGQIAPSVLITGDPLRAKHYAENFLDNAACYNSIRGMLGYTGTFHGIPISIQGTGIGIPSTALYVHELIHGYGVKRIIRVGTCGAMQKNLNVGEVIAATEAGTDSAVVEKFMRGKGVPQADPVLMSHAERIAGELSLSLRKGPVFSTDLFYSEDSKRYDEDSAKGVLGVDMETSVLYAMGKKNAVQTLSLLTVSDNLITGAEWSAVEREKETNEMVRLAVRVVEAMQRGN